MERREQGQLEVELLAGSETSQEVEVRVLQEEPVPLMEEGMGLQEFGEG